MSCGVGVRGQESSQCLRPWLSAGKQRVDVARGFLRRTVTPVEPKEV